MNEEVGGGEDLERRDGYEEGRREEGKKEGKKGRKNGGKNGGKLILQTGRGGRRRSSPINESNTSIQTSA